MEGDYKLKPDLKTLRKMWIPGHAFVICDVYSR